MKICFPAILLLIITLFSTAQTPEKKVPIKDLRGKGVIKNDTTTTGHKSGELYVKRVQISVRTAQDLEPEDFESEYAIHFFRPFNDGLRNYQLLYRVDEDFDTATYKWLSDSCVSVTLINSITNDKRNFRLFQPPDEAGCCSAGIMPEDLEIEKK